MSINLTTAQRAVEALMDDLCIITHDVGVTDDAFDEATGKHVPADPDSTMIYAGPCKITPAGGTSSGSEGGATVLATRYRGSLPASSPPVPVGSLLRVTSSLRDVQLVGRVFRVTGVAASTFLVQRRLELELRQ